MGSDIGTRLARTAGRLLDGIAGELDVLADPGCSPERRHVATHDARRSLKRMRALARLIRAPLGHRHPGIDRSLRDAGRRLSGLRDAAAMVEAVDQLVAAFPELPAGALEPLRTALLARRAALVDAIPLAEAVEAARVEVGAVRDALEDWPEGDGFALVGPGLRRTYRGARRGLAAVRRDPAQEVLHDWRKRVKDHRYQLELLRAHAPERVDERLTAIHQLTDHLGEHHDLDELERVLKADGGGLAGPGQLELALALADRRRARHRSAAVELGRALFADKPGEFTSRVARWIG